MKGTEQEMGSIMNEQCRIVVCHRRWIFVGLVSREDGPAGPEIVIRRAKNIRRWVRRTALENSPTGR